MSEAGPRGFLAPNYFNFLLLGSPPTRHVRLGSSKHIVDPIPTCYLCTNSSKRLEAASTLDGTKVEAPAAPIPTGPCPYLRDVICIRMWTELFPNTWPFAIHETRDEA